MPQTLKPAYEKDLPELIRAMPKESGPGSTGGEYSKIITYTLIVVFGLMDVTRVPFD